MNGVARPEKSNVEPGDREQRDERRGSREKRCGKGDSYKNIFLARGVPDKYNPKNRRKDRESDPAKRQDAPAAFLQIRAARET